jgi:hypothetical protein
MTTTETPHPSVRLHSFGGNHVPPPFSAGWPRYLGLPTPARESIWRILAPALLSPSRPGVAEGLRSFCVEHDLAEEQVVAAVHACEILFRHASSIDLDRGRFEEDLRALSGDDSGAVETLLSRFDSVKRGLRRQLLERTLEEHGALLQGVDWRVDRVLRSNHGTELNASVVLVTLRYREGAARKRLTLQLSPGALEDIQAIAAQFGG